MINHSQRVGNERYQNDELMKSVNSTQVAVVLEFSVNPYRICDYDIIVAMFKLLIG